MIRFLEFFTVTTVLAAINKKEREKKHYFYFNASLKPFYFRPPLQLSSFSLFKNLPFCRKLQISMSAQLKMHSHFSYTYYKIFT